MPNKTIEQYQAEIEQLSKAASLPGVPDDEKAIYTETIRRIEGKIVEALRAAPPAPQSRALKEELPPIPIRVIKAGQPPANTKAPHKANAIISGTKPTSYREEGLTDGPRIAGVIIADRKTVVIDWGHGRSDTLTEGEARGRFTTAMRDLAESRMARRGRMDDIRQYVTFDRAVAYYRALTEFWLSAPTPQQLAICPLSKIKSEIFEMIQTTAAQQ